MADAGIVRNRLKIEATIANARAILALRDADRSFEQIVLAHRPPERAAAPESFSEVPGSTPESTALAKALKQAGIRFVGPTTAYALQQAVGHVNDHLAGASCATTSRPSAGASSGTDLPTRQRQSRFQTARQRSALAQRCPPGHDMPGVVRKRSRRSSLASTYPSERQTGMPSSVQAPGAAGAAPTSRDVFAWTGRLRRVVEEAVGAAEDGSLRSRATTSRARPSRPRAGSRRAPGCPAGAARARRTTSRRRATPRRSRTRRPGPRPPPSGSASAPSGARAA